MITTQRFSKSFGAFELLERSEAANDWNDWNCWNDWKRVACGRCCADSQVKEIKDDLEKSLKSYAKP